MEQNRVVGVTVGVGDPYAQLAALAAQCFEKRTGFNVIVLGEKEFAMSGLSHPAALRLKLFDHIDADIIAYFDADWFCVQDMPNVFFHTPRVLACRDFLLKDESPRQHYVFESKQFLAEPIDLEMIFELDVLRHDYIQEIQRFADLRLSWSKWINTGLFIINREYHKVWLKTALKLYLGQVGHHDRYFEQPALNKAIEKLGLEVCLLPRRLNVLALYDTKWPAHVVGLHVKAKRHTRFLEKVNSGEINTASDVEQYFHLN